MPFKEILYKLIPKENFFHKLLIHFFVGILILLELANMTHVTSPVSTTELIYSDRTSRLNYSEI